jgi:hypothetical protein
MPVAAAMQKTEPRPREAVVTSDDAEFGSIADVYGTQAMAGCRPDPAGYVAALVGIAAADISHAEAGAETVMMPWIRRNV